MDERLNQQTTSEKIALPPEITAEIQQIGKNIISLASSRPETAQAEEQKHSFFEGKIDQPLHSYPKLEEADFGGIETEISEISKRLNDAEVPEKFLLPYQEKLHRDHLTTEMLEAANNYNHSHDPESRRKFMEANIELYGEPDQKIFEGLIKNMKTEMSEKSFSGQAEKTRQELLSILPDTAESAEAFRPNQETIEWAKTVVETLYGDFLEIIPDQEEFTAEELKGLFEKALRDVIGEEADDWSVILAEGTSSVNVSSAKKQVQIPSGEKYTHANARDLMVHEIGVHVLRALMGSGTNVDMLQTGLPGYMDAEEGLAVVFEQAINGEYKERGVPYYLAAGIEYFADGDFREAFEVLWRYDALKDIEDGADLSDEKIKDAKDLAYTRTFRINRLTDDLPRFKDLSYYNGNAKIWKHIEDNVGDPDAIINMFYGKIDPTNSGHMRVALDATPE